jgi:RNA polymerase sigma-70 factor (ECF subfamily)
MEAMTKAVDRDLVGSVAPAAAGDDIAFGRIVAAYHDDMRRVATYISRDKTLAEEATQAAWIIAWKKISDVRDEANLRPWLMAVAANEAKRVLRKRRRRAEIEVSTDASEEPGGIDPATGAAAMDLRAALDRLDPDDRALLALRYVAGLDSNELATATGISPSGTRNRLERLRNRLRQELE